MVDEERGRIKRMLRWINTALYSYLSLSLAMDHHRSSSTTLPCLHKINILSFFLFISSYSLLSTLFSFISCNCFIEPTSSTTGELSNSNPTTTRNYTRKQPLSSIVERVLDSSSNSNGRLDHRRTAGSKYISIRSTQQTQNLPSFLPLKFSFLVPTPVNCFFSAGSNGNGNGDGNKNIFFFLK